MKLTEQRQLQKQQKVTSFNDFLDQVPKLQKIALPGKAAQHRMAAVERLSQLQDKMLALKTPKQAAVMMLIYPKDNIPYFVLIERMESKGAHSGQIAFPGGRKEDQDSDLSITALRETHEEIGVTPELMQLVRAATPMYIPPSNYMVYPYLAFAKATPTFHLQTSEVQSIIEVPLTDLLNDDNETHTLLSTSYMKEAKVPCYLFNNQIVWGATAMILSEFKALIKAI